MSTKETESFYTWCLLRILFVLCVDFVTFLFVCRLQAEEEAVVKLCLETLSLRSLSKEPSVSPAQMIQCCERLLEQRSPHMQGLQICVSHFYSVMQDGDLCVPWDWKSWPPDLHVFVGPCVTTTFRHWYCSAEKLPGHHTDVFLQMLSQGNV